MKATIEIDYELQKYIAEYMQDKNIADVNVAVKKNATRTICILSQDNWAHIRQLSRWFRQTWRLLLRDNGRLPKKPTTIELVVGF